MIKIINCVHERTLKNYLLVLLLCVYWDVAASPESGDSCKFSLRVSLYSWYL